MQMWEMYGRTPPWIKTPHGFRPNPMFPKQDAATPAPYAAPVERLAPHLLRDGLFFVGIDVIGGCLTEVNVTSPTGIQEINALEGVRLEHEVIAAVEARVRRSKS